MSKGMIVVGYQGIGKSTLAKNGSGYIDLESGNFWIDGKRADDWYIPYCNIAIHLAQQGYTVFTSSHQVVRDYLTSEPRDITLAVCVPDISLKDEWIKKLEDRYNNTKLEKDYKAWMNAVDRYDENIDEILHSNGFDKIMINQIPYNLDNIIKSYLMSINNVDWVVDERNGCIIEINNTDDIPTFLKEHLDSCENKSLDEIIVEINDAKEYLNSLSDDDMNETTLELKNYLDKVDDDISNIVSNYIKLKEDE